MGAEAQLRGRLEQLGLRGHADALLGLASPSIQLRGGAQPPGQALGRPPARVWGLEAGVTAIAGGGHKLALREDGSLLSWGYNERGQLGDGSTKFRRSPVPVCDVADAIAISSGHHSLALTAAGGVLAWGLNRNGQLGDGTQTDRHTPVAVQGLGRNVIAVVAGEAVSFALTSDGSVLGWGASPSVEFGVDHAAPVAVRGLESGIVAIAAGRAHRVSLTSEGAVLTWGSAHSPALGCQPADPPDPPSMYGPARVEGLPAICAIAAGPNHNLALTADGSVLAWGENLPHGALGDGTTENRYRPVRSAALTAACERSPRATTAATHSDYGSLLSWGWSYEGRLGDGKATKDPNGIAVKRLTPAPVPALGEGVLAVDEFVVLMGDGSVRAWGSEYPPDERGADARLGLAATKLGGRPDLRARSRWPTRDGRPLSFVAQIDLAQLAPLDRSGLLPRAGLLSFFYGDPAGPASPIYARSSSPNPGHR